jgi:hypothetical protein
VPYLTQLERKPDVQPSSINPRIQGSPIKSQMMNKLEDYNDSGYGGSPLPPGTFKKHLAAYFVVAYLVK